MAARINNEEAIANNGANVSLQEFNYHAQSICKIEQLPAFGGPINVGTGFLFRVPPYGESKAGHCGIMTCTHVMPNIYKIKDLNENKYQFTFKGIKPKFAMIAQPQYFARIHRTPDDSDKSRRLDITFLEFDIEAIRLNEPIIGRIYYLPPVTYEGDYRATKENVYNTDSDLFSVHYAGGYEMHPAAGRLEMDGWQYQLLTHSLNTDKGSSGAPLIDVSTKRVIAVHRGDVRSKESQNNWHYYPNGATNILPIVDFIRGGTKRDDYIVCNSAVEAESTDDTDGRSVENGRSDAASASARQPAGAHIPYEDEVLEECWQAQLTSDTASELLTFMTLGGESSAVLNNLKRWKVINDAELRNLISKSNPLEQNMLYFQILGSKSIDNVRTAIKAFRPDQNPVADILEGMLTRALKEMSSKVAKKPANEHTARKVVTPTRPKISANISNTGPTLRQHNLNQGKNGTADKDTTTGASPEVRSVYFTLFSDYKNIIIQNVNLGVNGITGQLAENGVIEDKCVKNITRLHLNDKEKRGTVLITYLLDENDVDRYEGFLDVWATADADTIRTEIHEALKNQGLKVPKLWARA